MPATPAQAADCNAVGYSVASVGGPNFYIDAGASPAFKSSYTGYKITKTSGAIVSDLWVELAGFTGGALSLGGGQPAAQRLGNLASGGNATLFWYLTASGVSAAAQNHTVTVYQHNPALPNAVALCTMPNQGFAKVASTITANSNTVDTIGVSSGASAPTLGATFTVSVTGQTGNIGAGETNDPGGFWMSPSVLDTWPAGSLKLIGTTLTMNGTVKAANTLSFQNTAPNEGAYTAVYTFQAVGVTSGDTLVRPVQEIASGTQVKHTGAYPTSIPPIMPAANTASLNITGSATRLDTGGGSVNLTSTVAGTAGAALDSFVLTPPAGTTITSGSVKWNGVTVDDAVASAGTFVFPGPFVIPAGGTAGLTYTAVLDGDPGSQVFSLLGQIGTAYVGTSAAVTNGSGPATYTVAVNNAPVATNPPTSVANNATKTFTAAQLATDVDSGDTLTVSGATGASHGSVAIVSGEVVYTPTAGYTGSDTFTYTVNDGHGGVSNGTVTMTVTSASAAQAITFVQPVDQEVGGTLTVDPTTDSGLVVSLTSSTTSVCTVSGFVIAKLTTGTCTILADQAGNLTWAAAPQVSRSFAITKKAQSLTFAAIADATVGGARTVAPTATSSLTVALTSATTSVCSVSGFVITTLTTGTCTIHADQAGDATYAAASRVSRSFAVAPGAPVAPVGLTAQTITFTQPSTGTVGDTFTPVPVSDRGLSVTVTSATPSVCTVSGDTVTLLTAGTCTLNADQPGDTTYDAAPTVTRSFIVAKKSQAVTFNPPADQEVGDTLTVAPTASSGRTVALTSSTTSVCTVSGFVVTLLTTGTCTILADQAGNDTWAAAPQVSRSFTVTKKAQSITFVQPAGMVIDATFTPSPTSDSGLAVTLTSKTSSTCTVSAGAVTAVAAGTCTLAADQAGNATYAGASTATRTFVIGKKSQTITFPPIGDGRIGDPLTLSPTATSGLPVALTSTTPSVCTVTADGTGTLLTAGTCTIEADQPGSGSWASAATATRSFTVGGRAQTISFTGPAAAVIGDTRTPSPTATSGLAVTLSSTTPGTCTVAGDGTVTALAAGTCTLAADQSGNDTWAPATAVTRSFPIGRKTQTITFAAMVDRFVGGTLAPMPTATSGLAATLVSTTPLVCTVAGGRVTAVAAGTCTLTADQAGDATWDPAPQVSRSFAVTRVAQTITVTQPAVLEAESSYDLVPMASSDLPVTLVSATPTVCTVSGGVVTALAPGRCTLVASQHGNGTYAPATDVTTSVTVTGLPLKAQTIAFSAPAVLLSGAGAVSLAATASSQLPVSLALVSGDCGLSDGSLTAPKDTTCTVSATQAGGPRWSPAPPVSVQIQFVSPADDSVSMASPLTAAKSMDVRMLANDPSGLTLEGAGSPAHGSFTAGGDNWMTYTPREKFHGVDEFSYTVSDVRGRTARAMVRVDVANADPVVSGGTIEQLAGTTARVAIEASDPNDDAVTLSTTSERHVDSSIGGRTVRVSPDETVSGWTVVRVRVADDFGGSAVGRVRSLVTPLPVARAERRLIDGGTVVSWPRAATAEARYKVLVDGKIGCVTVKTSCTIDRFLGPDFIVEVQVLGLDGTASGQVRAEATGHRQVLLRTVYFEPGVATLGRAQMKKLTSVAALIRRIGFHDAHVSGYTDSDGDAAYNLALSKGRTRMVANYLKRTRQIDSAQAWFGYNDPVAPNDSDAGKSLNRRVEILVSY